MWTGVLILSLRFSAFAVELPANKPPAIESLAIKPLAIESKIDTKTDTKIGMRS